ncbi:GGDEF domain-containing protein [Desulfonatronum sp. SC1]|uniref:GGDEF domain-containing protein n=1 Tax=Desulfonatronum sp. SC1 TaxID=2109626 RepID=UPI001304E356|nr:GGDEF domain-containing protein [Desulfonatronum sp. SC1]
MTEGKSGAATRWYDALVRPVVDFVFGWSVTVKVRLLLIILIVLPAIGGLVLLESSPSDLQTYFIFALVGTLAFIGPLSKVVADYLVMRDLRDVERFCLRLKAGNYHVKFDLPPQTDEERDVLVLKRNLNWMAHVISRREMQLEAELAKTHKERVRFADMSLRDQLTGLYNRRGMEEKLSESAHEARTTERPLTMLFLDADKFKAVNDTYGHQAGDDLLRNLGAIIRANVREGVDVPFRYGGDEFGVLLVGIDLERAEVIAGRILRAYNEIRIGESSLSIGVATMIRTADGYLDDAVRMLSYADQAAYEAKRGGGSRVHVHKESGKHVHGVGSVSFAPGVVGRRSIA